jgi:hypothetical protein
MKKPEVNESITITEIKMSEMRFNIIGTSPLMPHAVSAKAAGSLLFPSPKKNAAEKATSMKHEPIQEFRDACYMFIDSDETPTRLYMPGAAFHAALSQVAIDMIGAKKAQIARLTNVPISKIPVFGTPKLIMSIVRSSDMARTPDVRTLPILSEWCCTITIQFVATLAQRTIHRKPVSGRWRHHWHRRRTAGKGQAVLRSIQTLLADNSDFATTMIQTLRASKQ